MRMPIVNGKNIKKTFNYNIAEYMFKSVSSKNIKLKKNKNTIKTLKVVDYKNDYQKFTKFKIIRARKNDKKALYWSHQTSCDQCKLIFLFQCKFFF